MYVSVYMAYGAVRARIWYSCIYIYIYTSFGPATVGEGPPRDDFK